MRPAQKPKANVQAEPEPLPGVAVGDELYFQHKGEPRSGCVVAHGKHGCTLDHEGEHHRIKWEHVLGHKKRAAQHYNIIDQGEDGMIVEDAGGARRFVAIPQESREDKLVVKALIKGRKTVLFMKADGVANRPGLVKKQITDKAGHQTTRWVRANPEQPKQVQPGHHVGFVNGEHKGHGEVTAVGKNGMQVKDGADGVHRVPHAAITHHWEGGGRPNNSPHEEDGQTESAEDIARALFNTSELEKLPVKAFQPVDSWEELSEKAPEALGEFRGMLDKVANSLDLVTGKRPESLDHAQESENAKAKKEGRKPVDLKEDEYMLPEHWDDPHGYLFMGPLKGEKRAREKVKADYNGDWSQVRDMVRATIAVPAVTQIPKVLRTLEKNGMKLAQQPKNNLIKPLPGGYRDLNLIVRMPNGLLAELQVHVKPMTLAKEKGHKHYEASRSIEAKYNEKGAERDKWDEADRATHKKAMDEQEKLYGDAWEKAAKPKEPKDGDSEDGSNLTKAMNGCILFLRQKEVRK